MFFSKQILLGCLVVLAISAFSEGRRARLVTENERHETFDKVFARGKEPLGEYGMENGFGEEVALSPRRLRTAKARLVTSKKWQKMFAMGKEPRGMFENAYNYYFRKTLQMHRNKVGYTRG